MNMYACIPRGQGRNRRKDSRTRWFSSYIIQTSEFHASIHGEKQNKITDQE